MTSLNVYARVLRTRLGVALAAALALVMLLSAPAWAKTFNGTEDDDIILATDRDDRIRAKEGDDVIFAGKGEDDIDCGKGYDIVVTDGKDEDEIDDNCERVKNLDR